MIAKIMDGKKIANKILQDIKKNIQHERKYKKRPPGLAVICIGDNPSSKLYIEKKREACEQVGIKFIAWNLQKTVSEEKILNIIHKNNMNDNIDGILIQLPLPNNININKIITNIDPKKDIDGFHPYNIGCLCIKNPKLRPCTSRGIITLLKEYKINMYGLHALIIGASNIVGRPMSLELLLSGCTISVTHRFTKNIETYTKKSDLIVVAVGKSKFLTGKQIKSGSIIIDVGINKNYQDNSICGDIDFESVSKKASYVTPVPGGVGPMTVATLLQNTFESYQNKYQY